MKRLLKILCTILVIVAIVMVINFLPIYNHNSKLIDFYDDYGQLLNEYVNSIDLSQDSSNVDVPDYLEEISVFEIEINDSFVFFNIPVSDFYYSGIYFSLNDEYAQYIPSHYIEDDEFHIERKTLYVKGKMNNGEDWYMTEKLTDNWYYYEYH